MKSQAIFFSAGELSGDLHGAAVISELKQTLPNGTFHGLGGKRMRDAGLTCIADITTASTVGIFEPIRFLPQLLKAYWKAKKALLKTKYDALVLIDCQGFNMGLANIAKKRGIPVIYYISPQEWQWGTQDGGKKVLQCVDHIIAIFEKEATFYQNLGGRVTFVGHPSMDHLDVSLSKEDFYKQIGCELEKTIISIFPGSRNQELVHTAPLLFEAAKRLESSSRQVVISIAHPDYKEQLIALAKEKGLNNAIFYEGDSKYLIKNAVVSLSVSGTITLEHAFLHTPAVVAYRFNQFTFLIANTFFKKKLEKIPYFTLANYLENKMILPEFLQDKATPKALANQAQLLLEDSKERERCVTQLINFSKRAGSKGASQRAAAAILDIIKEKNE